MLLFDFDVVQHRATPLVGSGEVSEGALMISNKTVTFRFDWPRMPRDGGGQEASPFTKA
jgi:hypothetical protein